MTNKHGENTSIDQQIQRLIDEVFEKRTLWQQRLAESEQQIKMLDSKLTAYQGTLKDYWESIDKDPIDQNAPKE